VPGHLGTVRRSRGYGEQEAQKNLKVPDVNRDRGWRWLGVTYDPDTDPQMLGRPIQVDQRLLVPQITKIKFNNRPPLLTRCLVLCPGQVQSLDMKESVIFANGSIHGDPQIGVGSANNCILVCEGNIELRNVFNCLVIASGTVKTDSIYGNDVLILQKVQEAFGAIKFYDTKQAGIEAGEAQEGVAVKKVLDGKPFAKAGFKEGDGIIAINGTKVRNAEEFRRLVRRQTACSKEMVFKVGRGERTLELTVVPTDP
jgi:membrane-associated protease RseP (regulator of RpoE activity)